MRKSSDARSDESKNVARLLFLLAAGYLVLTKLVFARTTEFPMAIDPSLSEQLGAAPAYILLLLIGYLLAMGTPPRSRVRVATVGVFAVVAGAILAPAVGFALLVVAYLLRRWALSKQQKESQRPKPVATPRKKSAAKKSAAKKGPAKLPESRLSESPLPPLTEPSDWFEVRVDAPELAIDTDDGGRLEIEPGELCVRLRTKQMDDGEVAFLEVSLEIADHRGSVWQSTTCVRADCIIDPIEDDPADEDNAPRDNESLSPRRPRPQLVPLGDAPEAWRTALRNAALGRNLRALLDSRLYCNLPIGNRTHVVQMKYQAPRFDVGTLDSRTLIASVRELLETVNPTSPKWELLPIPTFALQCPAWVLVWFIAQDEHARDKDSVYDEPVSSEPPDVSLVPDRTAAAQPRVVYRATLGR